MSLSWMINVSKFSDAKNKNNESFLLTWMMHSDWSLWNNRFAVFYLAMVNYCKSHVNNRFSVGCWSNSYVQHIYSYWFVNIQIKKIDVWTSSDWKLINSGQKYCTLIGWLDATFFQGLSRLTASHHWFLKQEFDLTYLKIGFSYATMNVWAKIWVQSDVL